MKILRKDLLSKNVLDATKRTIELAEKYSNVITFECFNLSCGECPFENFAHEPNCNNYGRSAKDWDGWLNTVMYDLPDDMSFGEYVGYVIRRMQIKRGKANDATFTELLNLLTIFYNKCYPKEEN